MREFGLDVVADLLATALSILGTVLFTLAGLIVDRAGIESLMGGALAQGAWELWMGTLALFVGLYLLGYRTALPALVGRR